MKKPTSDLGPTREAGWISRRYALRLVAGMSLGILPRLWAADAQGAVAGRVLNIKDFGAKGDGKTNDHAAFRAALAASEGKKLIIPSGTYYISPPSDNKLDDLLLVPSGCAIEGQSNPVIKWDYNYLPLLNFVSCSGAALRGIRFIYTGSCISGPTNGSTSFPYSKEEYFKKVGFEKVNLGGTRDICRVVVCMGADKCTFEDISVQSERPGQRQFAYIGFMTLMGHNRLESRSSANIIRNISLLDYQMGMLCVDQEGLLIENIASDRRVTVPDMPSFATGHVIYLSSANAKLLNANCIIRNISEAENAISYDRLGSYGNTLSIRYVNNCLIDGVKTFCPEGIAQISAVDNLQLQNVYWKRTTHSGDAPYTALGIIFNGDAAVSHSTFKNITIISDDYQAGIGSLLSEGNLTDDRFEDITIQTDFNFAPGQGGPSATISLRGGHNLVFNRVKIIPSKLVGKASNRALIVNGGTVLNSNFDISVTGPHATSELAKVGQNSLSRGNNLNVRSENNK